MELICESICNCMNLVAIIISKRLASVVYLELGQPRSLSVLDLYILDRGAVYLL